MPFGLAGNACQGIERTAEQFVNGLRLRRLFRQKKQKGLKHMSKSTIAKIAAVVCSAATLGALGIAASAQTTLDVNPGAVTTTSGRVVST